MAFHAWTLSSKIESPLQRSSSFEPRLATKCQSRVRRIFLGLSSSTADSTQWVLVLACLKGKPKADQSFVCVVVFCFVVFFSWEGEGSGYHILATDMLCLAQVGDIPKDSRV